jgi:acyl-coenzyme A synthetase/AMP-(fatty) acid ligase
MRPCAIRIGAACEGRLRPSRELPGKLVDQFPMTITGKVQKFVMREMATAQLGGV